MQLPDYWLTRPRADLEAETRNAFDGLLATALRHGDGREIPYTLPAPKWQFLCHIADQQAIALHGSGDPGITLFEPRQAIDLNAFGDQKAIYAAADGLWPMFFAVVDRDRWAMTINNACLRLVGPDGAVAGPYYFFSISQAALAQQPWRTGTLYLLPRQTFVAQPALPFGDSQVQVAQLASFASVRPLAKLTVAPDDFPFLKQIRGHDDRRLQEYATALQTGAPWPEVP